MRAAALATALLLCGCAQNVGPSADAWLVGSWSGSALEALAPQERSSFEQYDIVMDLQSEGELIVTASARRSSTATERAGCAYNATFTGAFWHVALYPSANSLVLYAERLVVSERWTDCARAGDERGYMRVIALDHSAIVADPLEPGSTTLRARWNPSATGEFLLVKQP